MAKNTPAPGQPSPGGKSTPNPGQFGNQSIEQATQQAQGQLQGQQQAMQGSFGRSSQDPNALAAQKAQAQQQAMQQAEMMRQQQQQAMDSNPWMNSPEMVAQRQREQAYLAAQPARPDGVARMGMGGGPTMYAGGSPGGMAVEMGGAVSPPRAELDRMTQQAEQQRQQQAQQQGYQQFVNRNQQNLAGLNARQQRTGFAGSPHARARYEAFSKMSPAAYAERMRLINSQRGR